MNERNVADKERSKTVRDEASIEGTQQDSKKHYRKKEKKEERRQ
jgi:hypothetical protein